MIEGMSAGQPAPRVCLLCGGLSDLERIDVKRLSTLLAVVLLVGSFLLPEVITAETYTVSLEATLSDLAARQQATVQTLASVQRLTQTNLTYARQVVQQLTAAPAPLPEEPVQAAPTAEGTAPAGPVQSAPVPAAAVSAAPAMGDAEAKEWIAQKESGGSYTAQNGRYIGRYQLTDAYLNGDFSAENQERVADAYVAQRYGSWSAAREFWLVNGWY